jgi:replication-associated recombination protein RarA
MNTNYKYSPNRITDVVWPNDMVKKKIMSYVDGANTLPLVLHGPYGTGKSLIASLIPRAIDGEAVQIERINSDELNSAEAVRNIYNRGRQFDRLFVPAGQRQTYTLIDEVEIHKNAKHALRICLDEMQGRDLTIMTTNDLHKLDAAIQSRAEVLCIPPATPERFLPRAQFILRNEGIELPDATVSEVLDATYERHKDNRKYYAALDELILRVTGK